MSGAAISNSHLQSKAIFRKATTIFAIIFVFEWKNGRIVLSLQQNHVTMELQDRYINLTSDFGFKRIFGTDMNKDLLIGFLNALFKGQREVKNVSYKNNEHLGSNNDARRAIFDVYCEAADGSKFIVEMQNAYQEFYKDRSVYYSTFPISEQAQKGDWDYELKPVYTVGILNFAFPQNMENKNVVSKVMLVDVDTKEVFYDKFGLYYVELANFNRDEHHLVTLLDKWLFVLKNMQRLMERPAALQERVFKKLFEAAEIAKYTPEERKEYEQSQRAYNDIKIAVDTAKKEGRAEGRAEGERKNAIKTATAMKNDGMPTNIIAKYTGMTAEEIERL